MIILLGLIGAMTMGAAYPAYRALRRKKKAELTPQILALTDELMEGWGAGRNCATESRGMNNNRHQKILYK